MDLANYLRSILNRGSPRLIDLTSTRPREIPQTQEVIDLTHEAEALEPTFEEQISIFLRLIELDATVRSYAPGHRGLAKRKINAIGCWKVRKSRSQTGVLVFRNDDHPLPADCAICLEGFNTNNIVRCLPSCEHVFHKPCIDKWLSINDSCPLDRSTLN